MRKYAAFGSLFGIVSGWMLRLAWVSGETGGKKYRQEQLVHKVFKAVNLMGTPPFSIFRNRDLVP
jgi:hypothetical protein